MPLDSGPRVFFNPACSTCRTLRGLLEERGVQADYFEYLDESPGREELEQVLGLLGLSDPREMIRTKETLYTELELHQAGREALLDAMAAHPVLIQRPILIHNGRAVIARPPEKALELI